MVIKSSITYLLSGHEVYLVGGCVRDLILQKTPKDFDVITTADLKEVSDMSVSSCFYSLNPVSIRLRF